MLFGLREERRRWKWKWWELEFRILVTFGLAVLVGLEILCHSDLMLQFGQFALVEVHSSLHLFGCFAHEAVKAGESKSKMNIRSNLSQTSHTIAITYLCRASLTASFDFSKSDFPSFSSLF